MPQIPTKFFGEIDCDPGSVYSFPSGLPGFEEQNSFFFLTTPAVKPLLFLQSLTTRNLCFILLPILVVNPHFRLELSSEELSELGLAQDSRPVIGEDILCAAIVCSGNGESPTANLMAPVVVNLRTKIGMQLIHGESGYSHQHALLFKEAMLPC
jgi:flagellar assembly factor FliW